jgi:SRSO17 transposase
MADRESRFLAYVQHLVGAMGHADRAGPLQAYCTGLLLPGERKSIEPMAARLAPRRVGAVHQAMHHFVALAPWDDTAVLAAVRDWVLPRLTARAPVEAWILDDTGIPKKGRHSVGVARQYCGQRGKQDNCQVAVSLSLATATASLPIAWRIERDFEDLKQEVGLGHYEGRGWRGFHHHATLAIAAYGFLVAERTAFSPSGRRWRPNAPGLPPGFSPRGRPAPA